MLLTHWLTRFAIALKVNSRRRGRPRRTPQRSDFAAAESLEQRVLLSGTQNGVGAELQLAELALKSPAPAEEGSAQSVRDARGAAESLPVANVAVQLFGQAAAAAATVPLSGLPALHSLPGAAASLFLDFDGHFEAVWGSYTNVTTPVFDMDGDSTTFSDGELSFIEHAWQTVAEDFVPFNIDVTTVKPSVLEDGVPIDQANGVALRVAIGGSWGDWYGSPAGGVGYVDAFTNSIANTVYVFSENTVTWEGEAASHEAGHGFGLHHQSLYDEIGVKIEEYNPGSGSWAPTMGNPYKDHSTWYDGTSSEGSTIYQDDIAELARPANGFGYRADDHGDTSGSASGLSFDGTYWTADGIIGTNSDVDVFHLSPTVDGTYSLFVDLPDSANLDAVLELQDSSGTLLQSADPQDARSAQLIHNLSAGQDYYVHVTKTDTYGYVGQYALTALMVAPGPVVVGTDPSGTINSTPLSSIRVTFAESIDPLSFDSADVTLDGPDGLVAVTDVAVVAGSNDTEFDISFAPQSTWGRYHLTLGPGVLDLAGNSMNQDQDEIGGEATDDQFLTTIRLGEPKVEVNDVTVTEGTGGTTELEFTVTRTGDPSVAFTVDYETTNNTATADVPAGTVDFTRHTVAASDELPLSVHAGDLDGDGDIDVVSSANIGDTISWHENDGTGQFTTRVIAPIVDAAWKVQAIDFDGDGDNDVVASSAYEIAWYENDGTGNFTPHVISATGAGDWFVTDFDGDGDNDVLADNRWLMNDGNENFTEQVISITTALIDSIAAGDLDGDSDQDIVVAEWIDDRILWYENDGNQNLTEHLVSDVPLPPAHVVHVADVDDDGDNDILSTGEASDTVAWYENDGSGNFVLHVIPMSETFGSARSLFATDMDGDGDTDILAGAYGETAWLENDGEANFTAHKVNDYASFSGDSRADSVYAADLDGDGDLDVMAAVGNADTVDWFENSQVSPPAADYQPASGTLSFAEGETEKTFVVTVIGDTVIEGDESFSVNLVNSGVKITGGHGFGTILDDDAPILLFSDSFENGQWNGNWVEDSQNDWFTSTQRATDGSYSAEVDGRSTDATLTLAGPVDLTPYGSAELNFSWYIESGFDSGEYLALDLFDGSWHNDVAILRGNVDQENTWHQETITVDGNYLVDNFQMRFRAKVSGSREDANVDSVQFIATSLAGPPNQAPMADAGGPYATNEGTGVMLDGSASSDPDGTVVGYEWDLDNDGQYDDAAGVNPTFTPLQDGALTVGLRVTDDAGGTSTDTAQVTVTNLAPTAHAGGPYAGDEGSNIVLDGSASSDPASDIVSFDWDLDNDGQYDDASGVSVPFNTTEDGIYTVGLRVTDDAGAASTDSAQVAVSNVGPSADAGGPYFTQENVSVLLTAAGSTDPGSDIVSYEWDLDGDGQYDDASGVTALFASAVVGDSPVAVRVTDDAGAMSIDTATVTVTTMSTETVVFEDSFEVGTWNGNWVEDSQDDWFRGTQRATDGTWSAEVDGRATDATLTMANAVDLSGFAGATLTFSWYIESGFDSGEYVALDISTDGGLTWPTIVLQLDGNQDQENTWHHETLDLAPYLSSSSLLIRFRGTANRGNEDANVDNVRIVASGTTSSPLSTPQLAEVSTDEFSAFRTTETGLNRDNEDANVDNVHIFPSETTSSPLSTPQPAEQSADWRNEDDDSRGQFIPFIPEEDKVNPDTGFVDFDGSLRYDLVMK